MTKKYDIEFAVALGSSLTWTCDQETEKLDSHMTQANNLLKWIHKYICARACIYLKDNLKFYRLGNFTDYKQLH